MRNSALDQRGEPKLSRFFYSEKSIGFKSEKKSQLFLLVSFNFYFENLMRTKWTQQRSDEPARMYIVHVYIASP